MRAAAFDVNGLNALRNTQKAQTPEGVKEMARQYESLFLQTMMKTMRATVPQDGFLANDAQKTYTSLLDQEFASMMANTKNGVGFAKSIEKQLARQMGVNMESAKSADFADSENSRILENFENLGVFENKESAKTLQSAESSKSAKAADVTSLNIFMRNVANELPSVVESTSTESTNFENIACATAYSPLFEIVDLLHPKKADVEKNQRFTVENQNTPTFCANFSNNARATKLSAEIAAADLNAEKSNLPAHARAFIQNVWADAQSAAEKSGLNATHIVAHAALESGWGKHQPGGDSFNLFGIKANRAWNGKRVVARTTEFENGAAVSKLEEFRAYDSYRDAFLDYADFLQKNPRYAEVISAQNGNDFAQNLQKAGYATDPDYAKKLQRTIFRTEEYLRI